MSASLLLPFMARSVGAQAPPVPAAAKYDTAWTTAVDVKGPMHVAIGASFVFLADAGSGVRALALADGREAWSVDKPTTGALAIGDGLVFVVAADTLYALDERSGEARWSAAVKDASTAPAWVTGWVFIGAGPDLVAFRAADGAEVWRLPLGSAVKLPIVFDGPLLFAARADRVVFAIDLATGQVQRQLQLDVDPGPLHAVRGRLFFTALDGTVHAFKLTGDEADWRYPLRVPPIGAPAAGERCVFVTLFDNSLHALDFDRGNRCWSRLLPSRPSAGLATAGTQVIVPLTSGGIVLVNPKDGKVVANIQAKIEKTAVSETLEAFAVSADATLVATAATTTEATTVTLRRIDMKEVKR